MASTREVDPGTEWACQPGAYATGLVRIEWDGARVLGPDAAELHPWVLDVLAVGDPASQGSFRPVNHRATGKAVMIPMNTKKQRGWRETVSDAVSKEWGRAPTSDAVAVALDFVFPRRKSAPKTFTPHKTTTPDLDKMTRAVWDAMTHRVFADDAQVVGAAMSKREAQPGEVPGVRIRVAVLPPVSRPDRGAR